MSRHGLLCKLRIGTEHFSHFVQILSSFFGRCNKLYSAAELHQPQVELLVDAYPNMETNKVAIIIRNDRSEVTEVFSHLIEQILSHPERDAGEVFRGKHIGYEALILFFRRQTELSHVTADNILHSINSVYPPLAVSQVEAFEVKLFVEVDHTYRQYISIFMIVGYLLGGFIILTIIKVYLPAFTDQAVYLISFCFWYALRNLLIEIESTMKRISLNEKPLSIRA